MEQQVDYNQLTELFPAPEGPITLGIEWNFVTFTFSKQGLTQ